MDENYYLITQEWNDGDNLRPNFPNYHINAYVGSYGYCRNAEEWMEQASPYDYCDSEWLETEQEYQDRLAWLNAKGVQVRIYNEGSDDKEAKP